MAEAKHHPICSDTGDVVLLDGALSVLFGGTIIDTVNSGGSDIVYGSAVGTTVFGSAVGRFITGDEIIEGGGTDHGRDRRERRRPNGRLQWHRNQHDR